ncbi:sarcosine oxidase subunit alpha family protein [Salipiger sp. IMCC34102]|uniref:sarcosine oxidase subunit alpha family protein n=1 Tax=Salipiger sp. IMCC34102 TaxID=2510647 RepID=UPI00101C7199|nr:sarcosine oxidase subunit alpha family protein [Salipiger sp. IMCC34102]RYH03333.1 sarcosine oxidase subunit alpha family protein [Salipiger sp. IMCC34102]
MRLTNHGRLIAKNRPVHFTFNGKRMRGYSGDTLASALMGNDQILLGRSFKYHRPRGVVASGAEEPNALVELGRGDRQEPNHRVTQVPLYDGLVAKSQNHWPSLEFDVGVINNKLSRFLPAGFYYKTFIQPRAFWKHVYEPIIRKSAGLGAAPETADDHTYEHFNTTVDVLVAGGGLSGLAAALAAAKTGARVLLVEQSAHWGGRGIVDQPRIDGQDAQDWIDTTLSTLDEMPNVTMRTRTQCAGVYDHGYALCNEQLTDHLAKSDGPRQRLWRVRAGRIVTATGAIERPLSFPYNDVPGVLLASALRDYVVNYGVAVGERTVLVTNNDDAYRTALALVDAGLSVPVILDARAKADGELPERARARGIRIETGRAIAEVQGGKRVTGVVTCDQAGSGGKIEEIACDCVAMSGGWSPVVHLWSHCGGKLIWDAEQAMYRPDPAQPPRGADGNGFVRAAGTANGHLYTAEAIADGFAAGKQAVRDLGFDKKIGAAPQGECAVEAAMEPIWLMPALAPYEKRAKMWLDYQNDVKVSDVQLAAQEGFESVEHTKRYTTLGMATDQGKLSNINGIATLSDALDKEIPQVGTTTFRPPYTPLPLAAITGVARDELFQPVRRTPIHGWHVDNGAEFEPVGHWRRPYAYPRGDEDLHAAVNREVKNTRENVGLLDASTLGKIIVKGPDAGRFMDMLYTNMMSNLAVGKCRYGLMCSENGFLMDDGVVARLDEQTWLCHTTTGGAERVHAHMEDWLQTEWWDWNVYVTNVTEQYAQVAVVGPKARRLLQKLESDIDLSREALPFMQWVEGTIAGIRARVFRISFSGELSFEIAVPASQGRAFWDILWREGKDLGVMPYGTEGLHVLRAEKGFIMIGDETDGTIIPQDLGLHWAISKKKTDFLGKRGQMRDHMQDPHRWKLVGLETTDGTVLEDGAYAPEEGENANDQRNVQGRVTSTYYSPTLDRGIAMGLVKDGPNRMGEVIGFTTTSGGLQEARIVDPVFYDKDGEKQNV